MDDPADPRAPLSETSTLAQRAAAGDRDALAALYTRYLEAIRPFVRKKLGAGLRDHGHDVDDLLQEGFLVAMRSLADGNFDPRRGSFFAWLRTAVVRDLIDWLRRRQRDARIQGARLDSAAPRPMLGVATVLAVREEEARVIERVRAALAQLRERYLSVLVVRDLLQLTPEAAASELGWTYRQGIDAYHRARSALDRLLPRGLDDWSVFVDWVARHHRAMTQSQAARLVDPASDA